MLVIQDPMLDPEQPPLTSEPDVCSLIRPVKPQAHNLTFMDHHLNPNFVRLWRHTVWYIAL